MNNDDNKTNDKNNDNNATDNKNDNNNHKNKRLQRWGDVDGAAPLRGRLAVRAQLLMASSYNN